MSYFKESPIVITFPFEFIVPDMNFTDYAIVWNRNLKMEDRINRIPTMLYYEETVSRSKELSEALQYADKISDKKFCNFIYSNGAAPKFRKQLFYELNSYKRVDSLGWYLNNVGNKPSRGDSDWLAESIKMKSNYKVSIACNNAYFSGGIDEKLLTTFAAKSVPIFWGDPTVEEEFNPRAMINCHNYRNFEEIIQAVRKVDEDDELWYDMVSQPWQTEEQVEATEKQIAEYREFLTHIFMQDKEEARRAGEGSGRDAYMYWFEKGYQNKVAGRIKGYTMFLKKKLGV